jgi:hypothetical protein
MSFLRHEEIYRSDVGTRRDREQRTLSLLPALIGFDEFPVGYSLAGCPPAEPASASPTRNYSPQSTLSYNYFFRRVSSVTFLHEATRGEIIVDAGHWEHLVLRSYLWPASELCSSFILLHTPHTSRAGRICRRKMLFGSTDLPAPLGNTGPEIGLP